MSQSQAAQPVNVPRSTLGMLLKRRELRTPESSQKQNIIETQRVTEADVIDDIRRKFED